MFAKVSSRIFIARFLWNDNHDADDSVDKTAPRMVELAKWMPNCGNSMLMGSEMVETRATHANTISLNVCVCVWMSVSHAEFTPKIRKCWNFSSAEYALAIYLPPESYTSNTHPGYDGYKLESLIFGSLWKANMSPYTIVCTSKLNSTWNSFHILLICNDKIIDFVPDKLLISKYVALRCNFEWSHAIYSMHRLHCRRMHKSVFGFSGLYVRWVKVFV